MLDTRAPEASRRSAPPTRERLPQRVYWRRRIGVLVVLGLVGWAGVTAVTGLLGDDDGGVAEVVGPDGVIDAQSNAADTGAAETDAQPDAEAAAETDDAVDGAEPSATIDPEQAADTIPADSASQALVEPAEDPVADENLDETESTDGPPTTANPAKVHIVGDSDAGTFGPYLQTLLDNTLIATTSLDYKVSSGLARPDFFNWPDELRATLPEVDPDIVVVTFGGNDSQGLSLPQDDLQFLIGDPVANEAEWSEEYQRRVLEVVDILAENGREVVWVGIPNDDSPDVTARLKIQDDAVRAALEERPDVIFVDTWERFSGRDGNWAEFVVDPRDGVGKDVRADDGFHLNVTGAEILAIDIAVAVRDILREQGANI